MISSTVLDLPDHREEVMDACLRQEFFPKMMEHLPSLKESPLQVSLNMVKDCDIYLLILGFRYGTIIEPENKSITHLEYEQAIRQDKPCHIFFMGEKHVLYPNMIEDDLAGLAALKDFKKALTKAHTVRFFDSPVALRAEVINTLASCYGLEQQSRNQLGINTVARVPTPYVAHPYTLLHSSRLVGRNQEMQLLDQWAFKSGTLPLGDRIFLIVAIGGMGKSALTWRWVMDKFIAQGDSIAPFDGLIWWSFYETDASFNNFIIYALAYVSETPVQLVEALDAGTREELLITYLQKKKIMIVLDGIERILRAYGKLDSAGVSEEDLDLKTNNKLFSPLFNRAAASGAGESQLRRFIDPRSALFFLSLFHTPNIISKILISSRLIPSSFEDLDGRPKIGCYVHKLDGLHDDDALALWKNFGVNGSDAELVRLFNTFENYPMLIRTLAAEISSFRKAPGDFTAWKAANPNFNPFGIPLIQLRSHILKFALDNLEHKVINTLKIIAAFKSPVSYQTIAALVLDKKDFSIDEAQLDLILKELEDRSLVGWNKSLNRYDIHPIIRGVIWAITEADDRIRVYGRLENLFQSIPDKLDWEHIVSEDDLSVPIEYFHTLIELKKYSEAYEIFYERINKPTHYILNAAETRIKLLELFFPNGLEHNHVFSSNSFNGIFITNALALSYNIVGNTSNAQKLYAQLMPALTKIGDTKNIGICKCNYAESLAANGRIYEAERMFREAVYLNQAYYNPENECISLYKTAQLFVAKGDFNSAALVLNKSLLLVKSAGSNYVGLIHVLLAWVNIHINRDHKSHLKAAINSIKSASFFRTKVYLNRLVGMIFLKTSQLEEAEKFFNEAITLLKKEVFLEEEINLLLNLAELEILKNNLKRAEEYLLQTSELSDLGHFAIQDIELNLLKARLCELKEDTENCLAHAVTALIASSLDGKEYCHMTGIGEALKILKKYKKKPPADFVLKNKYDEKKLAKINIGTLGKKKLL